MEGAYLDQHVNEQRDGFDIPPDSLNQDMFYGDLISFEEIINALDDVIHEMLTPPDWDKTKLLEKVSEKYGISANMLGDANVRVRFGDTEDAVARRVLNTYQDRIIKDTSEIFDIKTEILAVDPSSDDFRREVNDIS